MAGYGRDVQMSAANSRRDLRLKLEGCSTCEDSEDETTQEQPPILFDALSSLVKIDKNFPLLLCYCCLLFLPLVFIILVTGYKDPRGGRVVWHRAQLCGILTNASNGRHSIYVIIISPFPRFNFNFSEISRAFKKPRKCWPIGHRLSRWNFLSG